jgi:hypothetical protein
MSDPTLKDTNQLLRRLVQSAERGAMGLVSDPPGRRVIFANRTKAPDGCCWYRWDPQREKPIPVEEPAVRGVLSGIFVYEKSSPEGTTTKVRVQLGCGRVTYEIETSLCAISGRGLVAGLLEAGEEALAKRRPITIGVREADKDQVLFIDVYTDDGGLQVPSSTPDQGDESACLTAVKTIRSWIGLEPDPWSNRFNDRPAESSSSGGTGPPPRGQKRSERGNSSANPSGDGAASATAQDSQRRQHESERVYDQSSQSQPTKEQAADGLVARAEKYAETDLAGEVQINGATLAEKLYGLAEYCDRDDGYVTRVADALQLQSLSQVAVGQVQTVAQMLLDEDMLRQNEEFEPDDQLPF